MSDEVGEVDSPESDVAEVDVDVDSGSVGEVDSGAAPEPQAAAPQQDNYYAGFRNIPQFRGLDDRQIAARLYETMQREQAATRALQQYQQLVPVVSEYLPNREAFQKWREAQQQQAAPQQTQQPQQPSKPAWWNPPQIKDSYRQYLTRDAEGREVIAEHAPLEAKAQLSEWMNYRADFARKFLDNPEQALGPMVEQIASQRATELVQTQITRQRQEQFVQNIESENAEWLYSDPEKKIASREGVIVQKYIEDAKALGITDPEARWDYSITRLERDLALQVVQQFQQQQVQQPLPPQPTQPAPPPASPVAAQAQKNMEFLRSQAQRTATRNSPSTTDSRVPQRPLTFAERLKADLRAQGIQDLE
jgi:hypothetical protein